MFAHEWLNLPSASQVEGVSFIELDTFKIMHQEIQKLKKHSFLKSSDIEEFISHLLDPLQISDFIDKWSMLMDFVNIKEKLTLEATQYELTHSFIHYIESKSLLTDGNLVLLKDYETKLYAILEKEKLEAMLHNSDDKNLPQIKI